MESNSWENHYKEKKSILAYPDENLVRLLRRNLENRDIKSDITAVDLGCGSGRHLKLLNDLGVPNIIGIDSSYNALKIAKNYNTCVLIQCNNQKISLKNNSTDIVTAWGSLHYSGKKDLPVMINEIYRVLKKSGMLFATLRTDRDTYLRRGEHLHNNTWKTDLNDLDGSIVSFYSENELKPHFNIFKKFQYGIMERSIVGDINKIISHWVLYAEK